MLMSRLAASPVGHILPTNNGQLAFVPNPLPRYIQMTSSLVYRLDEASRAVSTLAGVGETIPNPHLLIRPFLRREAVLSSRIEGTQASVSDLFLYEASSSHHPRGDVEEVVNYVHALECGMKLLHELPISLRLINKVHSVLMQGVRGTDKRPGKLRTEQVWIGPAGTPIEEARFVPPPANLVRDQFADLESFINEPLELPPLVQCALMHYQFEAIHPYLDGNGRIGRLLIVIFLCDKKILPAPLLYLSAYFERTRDEYYDQIFRVSATGDWESWLHYFLGGVVEQSRDALLRIRRIRLLHDEKRRLLQDRGESGNALRLLDELFANPYMTTPWAAQLIGVTPAGARRILERLMEAGIVEIRRETWPHIYVASALLRAIDAPISADS